MNDKVDLIENAEFGYCSLIKATENILSRLDIEDFIMYAKIEERRNYR